MVYLVAIQENQKMVVHVFDTREKQSLFCEAARKLKMKVFCYWSEPKAA